MMRISFYYLLLACSLLSIAACTGKKAPKNTNTTNAIGSTRLPGDSAIYGLACDGCTDSVIILLPESGEDPVVYDILRATKQRKVFGRPKIGDNLAIMINPENQKEALCVVDLDELKGSWVYLVTPKLREHVKAATHAKDAMPAIPDSVLQSLMVPREYGFKLKRDNQASPIGMVYPSATSDEESPVEYPVLKRYREWHVYNGKLILTEKTPATQDKQSEVLSHDTAQIVFMIKDSLQLRFRDEVRNYYRQQEE